MLANEQILDGNAGPDKKCSTYQENPSQPSCLVPDTDETPTHPTEDRVTQNSIYKITWQPSFRRGTDASTRAGSPSPANTLPRESATNSVPSAILEGGREGSGER